MLLFCLITISFNIVWKFNDFMILMFFIFTCSNDIFNNNFKEILLFSIDIYKALSVWKEIDKVTVTKICIDCLNVMCIDCFNSTF